MKGDTSGEGGHHADTNRGPTSVRGTGCAAGPERCEIHHIVPWEDGGLTDIDSMCLACPHCHHNIHDRGYIVIKTNTGYKIINPNNPPNGP